MLDCKKIRKEIIENNVELIKYLCKNDELIKLAIIQANDLTSSDTYVASKMKECSNQGFGTVLKKFDRKCTTDDVVACIEKFNEDKSITAIIVQLPLFDHLDKFKIINTVKETKDIDCFVKENVSSLYNFGFSLVNPCTPQAICEIIERLKITTEKTSNFIPGLIENSYNGLNITIIGKGDTVGKPLASMLLEKGATITVCNSKTKNLKQHCINADVIVVAAGKEKLITVDMVNEKSVIIDVGINRNSEGKLCGDADYENIVGKVKYITPVPGGVGQLTVAMMIKNLCKLKYIQYLHAEKK